MHQTLKGSGEGTKLLGHLAIFELIFLDDLARSSILGRGVLVPTITRVLVGRCVSGIASRSVGRGRVDRGEDVQGVQDAALKQLDLLNSDRLVFESSDGVAEVSRQGLGGSKVAPTAHQCVYKRTRCVYLLGIEAVGSFIQDLEIGEISLFIECEDDD